MSNDRLKDMTATGGGETATANVVRRWRWRDEPYQFDCLSTDKYYKNRDNGEGDANDDDRNN